MLSPDGTRIAVSASAVGGWGASDLWLQATSGSGSRRPLLEASFHVGAWSSDGALLVGARGSRFDERSPALSPNRRWIAYRSNETGRSEIFVSDFPAAARKWQVSPLRRLGAELAAGRASLYFLDPEGTAAARLDERGGSLEV